MTPQLLQLLVPAWFRWQHGVDGSETREYLPEPEPELEFDTSSDSDDGSGSSDSNADDHEVQPAGTAHSAANGGTGETGTGAGAGAGTMMRNPFFQRKVSWAMGIDFATVRVFLIKPGCSLKRQVRPKHTAGLAQPTTRHKEKKHKGEKKHRGEKKHKGDRDSSRHREKKRERRRLSRQVDKLVRDFPGIPREELEQVLVQFDGDRREAGKCLRRDDTRASKATAAISNRGRIRSAIE